MVVLGGGIGRWGVNRVAELGGGGDCSKFFYRLFLTMSLYLKITN